MVEVIDAFAHALPRPFYEEMNDVHSTKELEAIADERRFYDPDYRVEILDEYGIDKQVITIARPPIWDGIDQDNALEMTRVANDAIAEFANEYPDRLIPVATVPILGDGFAEEFERSVVELEMAGLQIFSNFDGEPVDSEEALPLYEKAEEMDVPIWLHPQLHKWHEWDHEYMLHKILGWPFDTSMALGRLVFGGVMDEYPDLNVIPHHMGAMVPHFGDRLELFHEMQVEHPDVYPYPVNEIEGSVEDAFSNFYGDTCRGGSKSILEDGFEFFGEDKLVFATDYPFGPEEGEAFLRKELQGVEEMDITEEQREQVLNGNIRSIID